MNQLVADKIEWKEIFIWNHPNTKDWFHSLDDIVNNIQLITLKVMERIEKVVYMDPLVYFFNKYYIESFSFRDISRELFKEYEISVSGWTISSWFTKYFHWQASPNYDPNNTRTDRKHLYGKMGNTNAEAMYNRHRDITNGYVREILEKEQGLSNENPIDIDVYNWYKKWLDKITYIFKCFGFQDDYIQTLILEYKERWLWPQKISRVINALAKRLIEFSDLNLEVPSISKQTITYRLKNIG